METKIDREFNALRFTPESLAAYIDEARALFPEPGAVTVRIMVMEGATATSFSSVEQLVLGDRLPPAVQDIDVLLSAIGDAGTYRIDLSRAIRPSLTVRGTDEIWAHGTMDVLSELLTEHESSRSRLGLDRRVLIWWKRQGRTFLGGAVTGAAIAVLSDHRWWRFWWMAAIAAVLAYFFVDGGMYVLDLITERTALERISLFRTRSPSRS